MYGLIEEDVHDPFGGVAVPLFGNRARAGVAVQDRIRFVQDALRVGSDNYVGPDLARDRAFRVGGAW